MAGMATDEDPDEVAELIARVAQPEQTVSRTNHYSVQRFRFEYIKQVPSRDEIICHYTGLVKSELLELVCETSYCWRPTEVYGESMFK